MILRFLRFSLGRNGTGTLFAPTNAALEGVGTGTVSLSALKHHFIPQYSLPLEALGRYFNLESLAGAPVSINVGYQLLDLYPQGNGEPVSVNANLSDLRAQSGIVHGIDRLLPLPTECGAGFGGCPSGTEARFLNGRQWLLRLVSTGYLHKPPSFPCER